MYINVVADDGSIVSQFSIHQLDETDPKFVAANIRRFLTGQQHDPVQITEQQV